MIELINTIEISLDNNSINQNIPQIDEPFMRRRLDAYKKMFPNLDCLGWYSADSA